MEVFFTEDENITKWIKYDEEENVIKEKIIGNHWFGKIEILQFIYSFLIDSIYKNSIN